VIEAEQFESRAHERPEQSLQEALDRIEALRNRYAQSERIEGVGVAAPGPFDPRAGVLGEVPNMPTWHHFELRSWLTQAAACPVVAINDANASILAEVLWGAAQGSRSAVFLTFSTGFGAGLWLDGRLYEGPRGLAGELGHVRLSHDGPVGFGKTGSVEGWLSGPGIQQQAELEALRCRQSGETTCLHDRPISSEQLFRCARAGDPAAMRVVERIGTRLGETIALLGDLFDPEVVVLGTIGIAQLDLLEDTMQRSLQREALPSIARGLRILPSSLSLRGHRAALAAATRSCP
jgi:glucokinase